MSEALRYNEGKPMMSYFMRSFPKMAEAVARVKEFGANKYDDGNWRLGNKPDKEYWDSLFRHLNYHFAGELYDNDSGCLHLGHAVWNLCALLELNHPDLPVIDEKVFRERMEFWKAKKEMERIGEPGCINQPEPDDPCGPDCPGCGETDGSGCADCPYEPMEMDQAQGCHTRKVDRQVLRDLAEKLQHDEAFMAWLNDDDDPFEEEEEPRKKIGEVYFDGEKMGDMVEVEVEDLEPDDIVFVIPGDEAVPESFKELQEKIHRIIIEKQIAQAVDDFVDALIEKLEGEDES